jgi:hypothetical protein
MLVIANMDGGRWPIQVCGDINVGAGAINFSGGCFVQSNYNTDEPPVQSFPFFPNHYPGIGVTAHACLLPCNYFIAGDLGSNVLLAKIDDQFHILRILDSAGPGPMFGPDETCRCCGGAWRHGRLRGKIISVSPVNCGPYRACDEFFVDAYSTSLGLNPMMVTLLCKPTASSQYLTPADWIATAFGAPAEVLEVVCCGHGQWCDCTRSVTGTAHEDCHCHSCGGTGTSFTGTGTGTECGLNVVIRFTHAGCTYVMLIYQNPHDGDPCALTDVPIKEVTAMACGLPKLKPGTRVLVVRRKRMTPETGTGTYEYDIVRACEHDSCANQCGEKPPPFGPPCCGHLCSDDALPDTLTATIEVVHTDCQCDTVPPPVTLTLSKWGGSTSDCSAAADVEWYYIDPYLPPGGNPVDFCEGHLPSPPNPLPYPTKITVFNLHMLCEADPGCGTGTGSGTDSGGTGPQMQLRIRGGGTYSATTWSFEITGDLNRHTSCCNPFFFQFRATGNFCHAALSGPINPSTTFKITITG